MSLAMLSQPTLLIVDDCGEDRKVYRRYLTKDPHQSYAISEAKSAEAGLTLYHQSPSDVVLLDFCLPDMTGLEFLDRLAEESVQLPLPVIMLTGQGDEAIAVQAIKRGAQDYLVKGNLNPDSLQLAVRSVLRQSSLHTQLHRSLERQRLIAMTALQIRQSLQLEEILETATTQVRRLLQCDRVLVYQLAADQSGTVVAESVAPSCASMLGLTIQDAYLQHHPDQMYSEGEECTLSNVSKADLNAYYFNLLKQFEVQAHLVMPILVNTSEKSSQKLWGLLIAHQCSAERDWQPDEIELFRELSVQLAIALQQAELLAQTQTALERQKELNVCKSQIIATVSHEYRTPLSSILAAASTLKKHHDRLEPAKRDRFLTLIEEKARQMASLVDEMLLMQELELDKTKLKLLPLDLLQFFADLIEEQQAIAAERHQLVYKITGNPKGFRGDRRLLRQIFNNLVSNAIKYSPSGGTVEFHLNSEASQVSFAVKDEGIGIPIEDQPNLFQAFSRASNVTAIPGSGLGLAIARACTELHGGRIALWSQLEKGTTVTVTLPKSFKPT
jgi:signal transduction histidine kinase/DNA-binding response OmpR family regulator